MGVKGEPIPYLGYDEARELSRMDAPVIHHITTVPALSEIIISIEVRNLTKIGFISTHHNWSCIIDSNQLKAQVA